MNTAINLGPDSCNIIQSGPHSSKEFIICMQFIQAFLLFWEFFALPCA